MAAFVESVCFAGRFSGNDFQIPRRDDSVPDNDQIITNVRETAAELVIANAPIDGRIVNIADPAQFEPDFVTVPFLFQSRNVHDRRTDIDGFDQAVAVHGRNVDFKFIGVVDKIFQAYDASFRPLYRFGKTADGAAAAGIASFHPFANFPMGRFSAGAVEIITQIGVRILCERQQTFLQDVVAFGDIVVQFHEKDLIFKADKALTSGFAAVFSSKDLLMSFRLTAETARA